MFAATTATYAEGTARFPEAGGSASFSRYAFDELVSFVAGWAQMLARWRRQSRFYSPTVDFVLRNAPCEVLVVAFPDGIFEE